MKLRLTPERLLPWLAAAGGGVLAFLGYAGFDQFYLEWICLVPILWAIHKQSPARAFFIGWVAGAIGHGGGFYWVIHMFREFAGMPWLPAFFGLVLLAAANGIVFAVWAGATRFAARATGWSVIWISPVIWTALEKFWPEVFPNYLGASQYRFTLLTQMADVTGVLGITFLIVYANTFIWAVLERRLLKLPFPRWQAAVFAVVFLAVLTYGAVRIHSVDEEAAAAPKLKVGLVQTNRGAGEKHVDRQRFLREHQEMSRDLIRGAKPDLLVWPESALTAEITSRQAQLPPSVTGNLDTPVLLGAVLRIDQGGENRIYNSAILMNGSGQIIGSYDKMILVPFGEYIPFGETFPILYSWSPYSSRFWRGENVEPIMLGPHPISVNICYEDIFPGQIRLLMEGGRDRRLPEAMFNLTDDSWYGDTVEPMEHLALAGFRAIEHRRPLVRSTTTGISAIIDPVGRQVMRTGQWTKETLVGAIPLMKGRTVYAILGDWIGWLCAVLAVAGIARGYQLTRRRPKEMPAPAHLAKARGRRPRKSS